MTHSYPDMRGVLGYTLNFNVLAPSCWKEEGNRDLTKTVNRDREGDYAAQANTQPRDSNATDSTLLWTNWALWLSGRFLGLNVHSPDDNTNKPDLASSVERNSSKGGWPASCFTDTVTDVRALQIGGIPLIRRLVSSFVLFFPLRLASYLSSYSPFCIF